MYQMMPNSSHVISKLSMFIVAFMFFNKRPLVHIAHPSTSSSKNESWAKSALWFVKRTIQMYFLKIQKNSFMVSIYFFLVEGYVCFNTSLVENSPMVLNLLFHYYFSLEKIMILSKFLPHKSAFSQVCLKLDKWFWRERLFKFGNVFFIPFLC